MDKERRSRLKSIVGQTRRIVEDDVRVQLRRLGIDENETKSVEKLPHLSVEDKELRTKIVGALEKEKAGDISYSEAFNRYVRHVGFTYVNRIAALRGMEVRNLIKETIIRRDDYGGRSRREYELAERERISDPYELLKAGLVEAFDEVSTEIKVLFDVNSEYSLVFPGHKALLELIRVLFEEVPEEDWKEDDVIGWIYQYYNEEARDEFKRAKRKPKADDIPVINQFYTPRWIVRVLVDNTLGRLWLEMNGRCPKLSDPVKRTKEQLEDPSGDTISEFCSYLVPLSQDPPPRGRKKVRDIKVLDPACGSGHFLVYAFDVLYRMYREDEASIPVEEIPGLILEHNLHGIDIDLRAVQLATLSLYLKAKSYNPKLKITKINLVCADARITDGKVRKAFLERFSNDPELQEIFAKIFEDLEYTFDVGSLLKVREPFERLLERRREEGMQAVLFPRAAGQTIISKRGKIEVQTELAMSALDERTQQENTVISKAATLDQTLEALKEFENEAMEKRDMGTLLFATEAEKSVGLLALLTQKYDVILMNPAYGPMPPKSKEYTAKYYPRTKNDYYATFIEQTVDLAETSGFVGMLTSRTFMFLKSFVSLREDILWNEATPELIIDTGFGVLDGATVETAATMLRKTEGISTNTQVEDKECVFCRLVMFDTYEKEKAFDKSFLNYLKRSEDELWHRATLGDLARVPGRAYAYWASSSIRAVFVKCPPLDRDNAKKMKQPKIADVKKGLDTSDARRFIREFWEVDSSQIGRGKKWVPFPQGGNYLKFYAPVNRVIRWENNGQEIKSYEGANVRNEKYYFLDGLTWTTKPSPNKRYFACRYLQPNCLISLEGSGIFSREGHDKWNLLAILCSELIYFLVSLYTAGHNWEPGNVAFIPAQESEQGKRKLGEWAKEAYDLLVEWDTGNETSPFFVEPWLLQAFKKFNPDWRPVSGHSLAEQFSWSNWDSVRKMRGIVGTKEMSLRELADLVVRREETMKRRFNELQLLIDEEVYRIYEIIDEDKALIEKEMSFEKGEISAPEIEEGNYEEIPPEIEVKTRNHVACLISFYIKKTIESDPDGIVPLHELALAVREQLANDFGEDKADDREKEIDEILGRPLEEWIAADYFSFHVNLYQRRPIFWHFTSSNFARGRGPIGAFNYFLHYHKLDRDTIPKVRMNYLSPELEQAKWKVDRRKRELQGARDQNNGTKEKELSKQLEAILSILEEIQGFQKALETVHNPRPDKTKLPKNPTWLQQKIAEVRDNGYNPVIDYGVRVNIEPLKEAGLLHKAAQRVK